MVYNQKSFLFFFPPPSGHLDTRLWEFYTSSQRPLYVLPFGDSGCIEHHTCEKLSIR